MTNVPGDAILQMDEDRVEGGREDKSNAIMGGKGRSQPGRRKRRTKSEGLEEGVRRRGSRGR